MVSFTKSKCPQFCFSYSVNSCSLIGVLSIFDIGVDRISELPPQLDKRTAATAENKIGLLITQTQNDTTTARG